MRRNWILSASLAAALTLCAPAQNPEKPRHPFTVKDWATLHSAGAAAVSPNGTILYVVTYGAEKGPTHREWWAIQPDGSHATKLDLPEGFSPMGYTRDGNSLYGAWEVNHLAQFAIFALKDGKSAPVPTTTVMLPRGIDSALPTPQGDRFAIVADPRPPDPLADVRHVLEPGE